jgi:hypothetical protein
LSTPPNYLDFATSIGEARDPTFHLQMADRSGINQVFIQVHNRGLTPVRGDQVWVLLLMSPSAASSIGSGAALPAQFSTHMQARDPHPVWLGNDWAFADPTTPYRYLPGILDVRTPQVVEYKIDFSTTGFNQVGKHICLAAFVTSTIPGERMGDDLGFQMLTWERIMLSKYFAAQWIILV